MTIPALYNSAFAELFISTYFSGKKVNGDVLFAPPTESLQTELLLSSSAGAAAEQSHRVVHPPARHFLTASMVITHAIHGDGDHTSPSSPSLCARSPVHPAVELGPAVALHGARRENEAQKYIYKFLK